MKTLKDQGLASTLVAFNIPIRDYYLANSQVWFVFDNNDQTQHIEDDFYRNEAKIKVQDFLSAQKLVKNIIHKLKGTAYATGSNNTTTTR